MSDAEKRAAYDGRMEVEQIKHEALRQAFDELARRYRAQLERCAKIQVALSHTGQCLELERSARALEAEQFAKLVLVADAARDAVAWDWTNNDPDCVKDMEKLDLALRSLVDKSPNLHCDAHPA
jgi:hypothetical protein